MDSKPFIFGVATSGENFTDRVTETARLTHNFQHGVNTVLISPRRWGKTSLVKKVCNIAQSDNLKIVYLDIFACRNDVEFYNAFASAIIKQTSSKLTELTENIKNLFTSITPKINLGIDPMTDFSLSFGLESKDIDIDEILQLPEKIAQKMNIRIVVCIDEFQQIAEFRESKSFQKRLRTIWQLQQRVSYCLFGSKKHLMNELFEKRSLPFYKFGDAIYLPKISTPDWVEYICGRFKSSGKSISEALAEKICTKVDNHSSYVQQLSWLVWIYTTTEATEQILDDALTDMIDQNSILFEKQTENLSSYQINFLRALADGVESEFTTQETLREYNLGTSANISIIKRALMKKELIESENRRVVLTDPVMRLWIKREFTK